MLLFEKGTVVKFEADGGIRAAILLESLFNSENKVNVLVGREIIKCKYKKWNNIFVKSERNKSIYPRPFSDI